MSREQVSELLAEALVHLRAINVVLSRLLTKNVADGVGGINCKPKPGEPPRRLHDGH